MKWATLPDGPPALSGPAKFQTFVTAGFCEGNAEYLWSSWSSRWLPRLKPKHWPFSPPKWFTIAQKRSANGSGIGVVTEQSPKGRRSIDPDMSLIVPEHI